MFSLDIQKNIILEVWLFEAQYLTIISKRENCEQLLEEDGILECVCSNL